MIFAEKVRYSETTHYDYAGFTVPMTLSLYNYYSSSNIISIYNWAPDNPQWWITGFNPDFMATDVHDLYMIGTVDFSSDYYLREMFNGFCEAYNNAKEKNDKNCDYFIIDEKNSKIWICWGDDI